jgi:hypothetical protein
MGSCYDYKEQPRSLSDDLEYYRRHKHAEMPIPFNAALHPTQAMHDDNTTYANDIAVDPEEPNDMDVEEQDKPQYFIEKFQGAGDIFGAGETFMDRFHQDRFNSERADNVYYPFASRSEWELASYLTRSGLSVASINKFISLALVRDACSPADNGLMF